MSLNDTFGQDVLPWLQLAEHLRTLNLEAELNVPQICVMGDQSSGKSSVLEALSGIPFPRGSGLVTRCPIRLVMRKARADEVWHAYVSTSTNPSKRFPVTEVNALGSMIDRLTNSLIDGSSQFSTDSIVIDLVSPDASDLTVVDLPGIIRTVTAGQTTAVIDQVNKLIKSFLLDKRTIILAVIPANQDIATVDILERAQGVDPLGERTVGVLTKVDLIGPGGEDEALAVVNNIRKPLKLGYVMLKNRSQRDLMDNVTTAEARLKETVFFREHPVFCKSDPSLYGIERLSKKLTLLLVSRIQREMSPMKSQVEKQLGLARADLRSMSTFKVARTTSERQKLLVTVMQEYIRHLTDSIRGEYRDRLMVRHPNLRMYTIALQQFEEFRYKIFDTAPKFKKEGFVKDLAVQIDQLRGRELPGFLSSQAFYMCMAQYIDLWVQPMQELVTEVRGIAQSVTSHLADALLMQYPSLREGLRIASARVLLDAVDDTTRKLQDALGREKDPFTLNDFLQQWVNKLRFDKFSEAVDNVFDVSVTPISNFQGLKEEVYDGLRTWYRTTHSVSALANAQEMTGILEAYWNLSAKRYIDNCCMIVDKEILGRLPASIQEQMYRFVRDDRKLEAFFAEDPAMVQRRENAEKRVELLVKAGQALSSIPMPTPAPVVAGRIGGAAGGLQSLVDEDAEAEAAAEAAAALAAQEDDDALIGAGAKRVGVAAASVSVASTGASPRSVGPIRVQVTIPLTPGVGLGVMVDKTPDDRVYITEFRDMPSGVPNPSIVAGVKKGDIIAEVDGYVPAGHDEALQLLKRAAGSVTLTMLRNQ